MGVDVVNTYKTRWLNAAKQMNVSEHKNATIDGLNFTKEFDVGVLSKVCLHVEPNEIDLLIKKMNNACERLIITTAVAQNLASHCFNHDYKAIFKKHGMVVLNQSTFETQIYYHIQCK